MEINKTFFHLSDNDLVVPISDVTYDPLIKLRPVILPPPTPAGNRYPGVFVSLVGKNHERGATLRAVDESVSAGGSLAAVCWYDNKPAHGISTAYGPDIVAVGRKNKRGISRPVDCLELMAKYNQYIGGTDRFDQFRLGCYSLLEDTVKWWFKVSLCLLDMTLVNAFVMYKHRHPKADRHVFLESVHDGLLDKSWYGQGPSRSTTRFVNVNHALQKGRDRDCKVCSNRGTSGR